MKGKIDKNGVLHIKRANSAMVIQVCSHCVSERRCGEWCPLFGEVSTSGWTNGSSRDSRFNRRHWSLDICDSRRLKFEDFTDEREKVHLPCKEKA